MLFEEVSSPNGRAVRRAQRAKLTYPGLKATDYLLSPDLKGRLEVIWAEAAPGGGSGEEPYSHEGDEECMVVLRGQMEIWVNVSTLLLVPLSSVLSVSLASSYTSGIAEFRIVSMGAVAKYLQNVRLTKRVMVAPLRNG